MPSRGQVHRHPLPLSEEDLKAAPAVLWLLPMRGSRPVERQLYTFGLQPRGVSVITIFAGIVKNAIYYLCNTASIENVPRALLLGEFSSLQVGEVLRNADEIDFDNNTEFALNFLRRLYALNLINHQKKTQAQQIVQTSLQPLSVDSTNLTLNDIDAAGLTLSDVHLLRVFTSYLALRGVNPDGIKAVGAPLGQSPENDWEQDPVSADVIIQWCAAPGTNKEHIALRPVVQIRRSLICFSSEKTQDVNTDIQNIVCGVPPWDISLSKGILTRDLQSSADSYNPCRLSMAELQSILNVRDAAFLRPREPIKLISKQLRSGSQFTQTRYTIIRGDEVVGAQGLCSVPMSWEQHVRLVMMGQLEISKCAESSDRQPMPAAQSSILGPVTGLPLPRNAEGAAAPINYTDTMAVNYKEALAAHSLTTLSHGTEMAYRPKRAKVVEINTQLVRGHSAPAAAAAAGPMEASTPRLARPESRAGGGVAEQQSAGHLLVPVQERKKGSARKDKAGPQSKRQRKPKVRGAEPEPDDWTPPPRCQLCQQRLNQTWRQLEDVGKVCVRCFKEANRQINAQRPDESGKLSDVVLQCYECHTANTTMWRWDLEKAHRLCNRCGLRVRRIERSHLAEAHRITRARPPIQASLTQENAGL